MEHSQKLALQRRLGELSPEDRRRLTKQAQKMRKASRERRKESDRPREDSLDLWMLKLLEAEEPEAVVGEPALVLWTSSASARVRGSAGIFEVDLDGKRPVVGDEVLIDERRRVVAVGKRKTKLSRPNVGDGREQVIAANVDEVVIVVSVKTPPLHPRIIDRFLIAIQHGGAQARLCLNKIDLVTPEERLEALELLRPYAQIGVPIHVVSTESQEGIGELREALTGRMAALVGHSGVGKSSLTNALYPHLAVKTGEVIQGYGRGAHTTTASGLFELPNGTRLIDTPGIKSFGLWKIEPEDLPDYFPEFRAAVCRFRDCSHMNEPGCGVREAASEGVISSERYETYLRLRSEG